MLMNVTSNVFRRVADAIVERLVLAVEVFIKRPAVIESSYSDNIESSSTLAQR
jgi:hypothetical protein